MKALSNSRLCIVGALILGLVFAWANAVPKVTSGETRIRPSHRETASARADCVPPPEHVGSSYGGTRTYRDILVRAFCRLGRVKCGSNENNE